MTKRIRQCGQKSVTQPLALSVAAEMVDAMAGAPMTATSTKAVTPLRVPSRCSPWPNRRRIVAAMIGCERLPVNIPSERPSGMDIVAATASCVRKAKRQ